MQVEFCVVDLTFFFVMIKCICLKFLLSVVVGEHRALNLVASFLY